MGVVHEEKEDSSAFNLQEPNVREVQKILADYIFGDEKLLLEALIHPSMKSCISYQRLEYIGNSVLDLLVARELFFLYPELSPGLLSRLRATNVDNEKLARVAVKHGLHHYLRHKLPLLGEQIQKFSQEMLDHPIHSNGLIDSPKTLADIVESLVGAVFVDSQSSLETVWKVMKGLLQPIIKLETLGKHPVTELLEFCQKKGLHPRFVKDSWCKNAAVYAFIGDKLVGTGTSRVKKEIAQNRAAKAALDFLENKDQLAALFSELVRVVDEEEKDCSPSDLQEDRRKKVFEIKAEAEAVEPNVREVQEILGYVFKDDKLLLEALIHPTFCSPMKKACISYERLEYIGDSVLDLLVARELFFQYPKHSSGFLSRLRAANVDTEKLARVAVKHGLHHYLRHKASRLNEQIQEFSEQVLDYPIHSNGRIDTPKALADIVEALIGAVFIDSQSSLDTVWKVFKGLLEPIITLETLRTHPVTELFEFCQKGRLQLHIVKDFWAENASVDVFIGDKLVGTATYGAKKEIAHNRAATAALDYLKVTNASLSLSLSLLFLTLVVWLYGIGPKDANGGCIDTPLSWHGFKKWN